jgi:dUTP pyrophosphatase
MSDNDELAAKRREKDEAEQEAEAAVAECAGCGGPIILSEEDEAWIEEVFQKATKPVEVRIKLLRPTSKAPQYMTAGAAGADVFADLTNWQGTPYGVSLAPDRTHRIPLGFAIEIPPGHVGLLKGRSGLASKGHDAHVAAIDSDYRGEVCMLLHVDGAATEGDRLYIEHGDRVGQLLIVPAPQYAFRAVDELSETERASGGFGHTGVR